MPLSLIGVDADDTLWHHETYYRLTHARYHDLLADYASPETVEARLNEVERRNIGVYGYGAKGFTLSMIETAIEISGARASASVMKEILAAGREIMQHPVEPLPGVADALGDLKKRGKLILITKGDLFHQETKLAASGLGSHFSGVEIVSEKTPEVYARAFARHGGSAGTSLMAGNSVRSDVLPMLAAGGHAALVPYPLVWEHEAAAVPVDHPRFRQLGSLGDLAGWIDEIG
ncbi:MAG: HAD family hydrolase [Alphaproteobacteria bacterium]|nr:HAD family hydrolase [Alphaproteobacteria bacterium]